MRALVGAVALAILGGALLGASPASATTPQEVCDAVANGTYQDFIMGKLEAGEDPQELARIDVQAQREVCPGG